MRIVSPRQVELTIRRPDGQVETLIHSRITYMTPAMLADMRKAMAAAGRGEVLSCRNIDAVVEMEDPDYMAPCDRCGERIDTRTAYQQQERMRHGSSTIAVVAHYCAACSQLLHAVGAGEHTAMAERASERPDTTPEIKEEC